MRKNIQIGVGVLIIALVGTGVGVSIGAYLILNQPSPEENIILTISGSETNYTLTLTMTQLKSSKYQQFQNLFYAYSDDRNGTYSGVSIRSILEVEKVLNVSAWNFTFVSSDMTGSFNPAAKKGYYLNITDLMAADYNDCIFAYGGDSFNSDISEDGPLRSIINKTDVYPYIAGSFGAWWVSDLTQMIIIP